MMKSKKEASIEQEKTVADFLSWNTVSGSGARPTMLGDISSYDWIGECKTHTKPGKKISFSFKVWHKICEEAYSQFKQPVLIVDDGSQDVRNTWCMVKSGAIYQDKVLVDLPAEFKKMTSINFYSNDMWDIILNKSEGGIVAVQTAIPQKKTGYVFNIDVNIIPLLFFKEVCGG